MGFLEQLKKSTSFTNILALDISIRDTGYCCLRFKDEEVDVKSVGLFSSFHDKDDEFRIMQICAQVSTFLNKFEDRKKSTIVAIERPPSTMYEKKFSKSHVIGRATSLFLTFAVYGALVATVRARCFNTICVYPIDWQKKLKSKDFDIKELSKYRANARLDGRTFDYNGQTTTGIKLYSKDHENIADAVNIAFYCWSNREKLLGNFFIKQQMDEISRIAARHDDL